MKKLMSWLPSPRPEVGLLVLRVAVGLTFVGHGGMKLMAGPARWEGLGGAMAMFGITFAPTAWGLAAALSEAVGGALVALGLFTRLSTLPLVFTMVVATARHAMNGDAFGATTHPLVMGAVFLALFFTGPGRYSLDARLGWTR